MRLAIDLQGDHRHNLAFTATRSLPYSRSPLPVVREDVISRLHTIVWHASPHLASLPCGGSSAWVAGGVLRRMALTPNTASTENSERDPCDPTRRDPFALHRPSPRCVLVASYREHLNAARSSVAKSSGCYFFAQRASACWSAWIAW